MNKFEMIKWLQNLKDDIGQTQHQNLWHYAKMLDEVIVALEDSEDCISREWLEKNFQTNKTGRWMSWRAGCEPFRAWMRRCV